MTRLLIFVFLFMYWSALMFNYAESYRRRGENVCRYREELATYKMKRKISRRCRYQSENCDNPLFPWLQCKEIQCAVNIKWYAETKTVFSRTKTTCCPGWGVEVENNEVARWWLGWHSEKLTCPEHTSCITISQFTPRPCIKERQLKLIKNRRIYQLTTPPENIPEKISEEEITKGNLLDYFAFPLLNLTQNEVVGLALVNADQRPWAKVYIAMGLRNKRILHETLQPGNLSYFTNFSDYAQLLDFYRKQQLTGGDSDKYFRYPSQEEDFKDIIQSDTWQDDKVFTEQRLTGLNPVSIRKLGSEEYQEKRSKWSPNLTDAIKDATGVHGMTFSKMVEEGNIFIVDYPLIHNLTNVADIADLNSTDRREMRNSRSPIALFASLKNCKTQQYELKPLAIQTDLKASAPLYTPADGDKWLLAKVEVQRADISHAEIIEHLLKTHLMMEPICVTIQRTLSVFHPLYEILKWHCFGTFMTNSLGLPSLVEPQGLMHKLFSIGHAGSLELLNKGYAEMSWNETDFEESLKKRGVFDREKLPYFPHRDDGIIIWRLIRGFADEYVDIYYKNGDFVQEDKELQDFANELSADGVGKYGGMGMVKDFPAKIMSKWELKDILARIVFLPLLHHAVNYPVAYYGGFVPNMPSKLYDDPRVPPDEFSIINLPQSHIASMQVSLAMSLGSLRFDKLFDYSSQMGDKEAAAVVQKYYHILMGPTLTLLRKTNKQRLHDGHATYPYFVPGWMPNSIHT